MFETPTMTDSTSLPSKQRRTAQSEVKIIRQRQADVNHSVVTAEVNYAQAPRPAEKHSPQPCRECPWKRENVGLFPSEAFRYSAHTAYDNSVTTFACHAVALEATQICTGFLLRGSFHNLAVRLMLARKLLMPPEDGPVYSETLFGSYRQMAEANGVDPSDPVLTRCRAGGYDD